QLNNGYINTAYIINDISRAFTNLRDFHELYCFGHLTEAACAYYLATGEDKLLNAAKRFAGLICETFGADKTKGYPGHEEAELALVKLYELTGEKRYLDTAAYFIDERGKKPYYFDAEHGNKSGDDYRYQQAHIQPRLQREATGHAVRAVYLYSGMADVAKYTDDDGLYDACRALAENIITKQMYITGGIGSSSDGEAFTFNYDLKNDLAYCETCASIGFIFFARRMLEIEPNAAVAAAAERALYNTVLSGMSEDGKRFFYVNPLAALPEASEKDRRKRHVKTVRQKWFACACCPPNLARLIGSLGEYALTENESAVYVHQYIGGEYKTVNGALVIESSYAENGSVRIQVTPDKAFTLAVRLPDWCRAYSISEEYRIKDGYALIDITGKTEININFEIAPRLVKCSNRVRENIGRVAVMRGPLVFCAESADNGSELQMLKIKRGGRLSYSNGIITAEGLREKPDDELYSDYKEAEAVETEIKLIPYYKWGNRGENEMAVYLNIE
ncbi:MAG: glycoside hydrolase family 127 protein, partial [Eubacterium sp.]|nr:glycoside hydrolase family 127 protein [Eubacterium sp.]